jgi:hypothetical protein
MYAERNLSNGVRRCRAGRVDPLPGADGDWQGGRRAGVESDFEIAYLLSPEEFTPFRGVLGWSSLELGSRAEYHA